MAVRVVILIALLAFPAGAHASVASTDGVIVTIVGGGESSRLTFATGPDVIHDAAGVTAGPGCAQSGALAVTCGVLFGHRIDADLGAGDDRIEGAVGRLGIVYGGPGADELLGGGDGNQLSGGPGLDLIAGGDGGDRIDGGTGADRLTGDDGSDAFLSRDGEPDDVICGPAYDFVTGDWLDRIAGDCERVDRGPRPDDAQVPPPPGARDLPAMTPAAARKAARSWLAGRYRAWRRGTRRTLGRARQVSRDAVEFRHVSVRHRGKRYRGRMRVGYAWAQGDARVQVSGVLQPRRERR